MPRLPEVQGRTFDARRPRRHVVGLAVAKKLRCYLGLHRFVGRQSDDGQPYKECRDCGKYSHVGKRVPPNMGM